MLKMSSLIGSFLGLFLLTTGPSFGSDYILYVRAQGQLGKELSTYWNAVKKDSSISHFAITAYPPHCSLTGFFPNVKSKNTYIQAVNDAIKSLGSTPRTISINGLVQQNETKNLDYIKLSSSYLLAVTKAFMRNASVPAKYLKNPQTFTYHITLRDHIFQKNVAKKMKKIQSLEKKIHLHAKASWSLFLYERDDNGDLSMIKEFPL